MGKSDDLLAFLTKFGIPISDEPGMMDPALAIERQGLLHEELIEYDSALDQLLIEPTVENLEDFFDAILDMIYLLHGTAAMMGFDVDEGWRRVHEANMAKVPTLNHNNKRRSKFDVKKPPGWKPPVLTDLVTPTTITVRDSPCGTNGSTSASGLGSTNPSTFTPELARYIAESIGLSTALEKPSNSET